jgi:hypothetical protein
MADPDRNKRRNRNREKAASCTDTGGRKQTNSEVDGKLLVSDDEDKQGLGIIADETDDEPGSRRYRGSREGRKRCSDDHCKYPIHFRPGPQ